MSRTISPIFRRPFEVGDCQALMRKHAPPPEYFDTTYPQTPDEIEALQLAGPQAG